MDDQQMQPPVAGNNAAAIAVATHPLQDIDLDVVDDAAAGAGGKRAQNWVKFDDDDESNKNNGHNSIDSEGNATHATRPTSMEHVAVAVATAGETPATATTATTNRLSASPTPSPLPAPPAKQKQQGAAAAAATTLMPTARSRSRSPLSDDSAAAESAVTPVQRTTISAAAVTQPLSSSTSVMPDVAPAVLNTESIHVNLNASGRTQHQQQQQQQHQHQPTSQQHSQHNQQQQQQQQQQYQKSKLSPVNAPTTAVSGSQQQQLHYHNNNGNASQHNNGSNNNNSNATPNSGVMHKTTSPNVSIPVETVPPMRTIELSTGRIREGFANGDVIVTLLPANTKWPWITPAIFRPELVPEELMAQGLTLTVEEYVNAMETLVNDYRFTFYNICYKRILVCWIVFAFTVLLTLLFSGLQGVALFSLGVGWLFLNAAAIFLCMWVKLRLSRGLEKCLARVNRQLMKHKILLVLDDRGRISCHKVNLCFLYFDATQCVNYLNEFLEHTEQNGGEAIKAGWERKLDIDVNDIVIQGNNPVRLSRKQERGTQLFLRYGSRWGMEALRGLVDVTPLEPGRHCGQFQCPCQYIKEHLQCKPRGYPCGCIAYATDAQLQQHAF